MKPNNNQPLETELVSSSFSNAYKTVMEMAKKLDSTAIDISAQMTELVAEVETLTQQLADSVLELDTKIDESSDIINQRIDTEVATLNQTINSKVATLNDRITATTGLLEEMINQLNDRVDTYDVLADEIILQGEALREGLEKIDAVASAMETVQQEVATLTTLVSSYDDAIQSLDNRATSLEGSVATINQQIETIDGFLQLASQEINAIKQRLDAVEPRVTALETTTSSLSTSVSTLDAEAVKTTGNQTIAGVKTFSDAPCIPSLASQTPVAVQSVVGFDSNGNLIAGESNGSIELFITVPSGDGKRAKLSDGDKFIEIGANLYDGIYVDLRDENGSFITRSMPGEQFVDYHLSNLGNRITPLEQANTWQSFGDWRYRIQGNYLEAIYTTTDGQIAITNASGNFYRSNPQTLDVPADILNGKTLTVVHATVNCGHSGYPVTTALETITATGITWYGVSGSTRNFTGSYYITAKIEGFLI